MLGDITVAENIYIAVGYTDMRKSIDGLAAIVQEKFQRSPYESAIFVFCGRKCDRIKVLMWEETGFVLLYKRLENGKFRWPRSEAELKPISRQQFDWLMSGLYVEQCLSIRPAERAALC